MQRGKKVELAKQHGDVVFPVLLLPFKRVYQEPLIPTTESDLSCVLERSHNLYQSALLWLRTSGKALS